MIAFSLRLVSRQGTTEQIPSALRLKRCATWIGETGQAEMNAELSRVAQRLQTSQSGMTGKLDRLERHGFIQRSPDPEDRRAIRQCMTDSGRALIDEAFTTSLSVYQSMLNKFSPPS